MSVYKEGYHALEEIHKSAKQIWPDACDFGTPVKEGSTLWNSIKQLCEWYGIKSTRAVSAADKKHRTVSIYVHLMDEWAVSDGRKTEKEATEFYKVTYNKTPGIPGYDGFVEYYKVISKGPIEELEKKLEAQNA